MSSLSQVSAGQTILASHHNEIYSLLKGVAGSGEVITLINNAAGSLLFQPTTDPAAGTEAIQIKNSAGTVQGSLTYDGKVKVADGTAALPSLRFQSEATGLRLVSAGVVGVSVVGADANVRIGASFVSAGANPAASGAFRMPNLTALKGQNAANSAGISLIYVDGTDNVSVGDGGSPVVFPVNLVTLGGASGGKLIAAGTLTGGGLLGSAVQVGTSGPLIYSGSGAPTISAAVKGSLYLRSDGTTGTTRAYIATDAAGTWTALNTVA